MDDNRRALIQRQVQLAQLERDAIDISKDAGSGSDVPPEKVQALVQWSDRYGLDVYAGHVLYMYGRPYVTAQGATFSAKDHLGKDYQGHSEIPLTHNELKEMGFSDKDVGWRSQVWVRDYKVPIEDIGVVTWLEQEAAIDRQVKKIRKGLTGTNPGWKEDLKSKLRRLGGENEEGIYQLAQMECAYLPIIRSPSLMAKARAIRRAHLSASPVGVPAGEPVGGIGTFESGDDGPSAIPEDDLPNFDNSVPPGPPPAASVREAPPQHPPEEPPTKAKSSMDPDEVKELNILCVTAGIDRAGATALLGTYGVTELEELSKDQLAKFKEELKKKAQAKEHQAQMPLTR